MLIEFFLVGDSYEAILAACQREACMEFWIDLSFWLHLELTGF